MKKYLAFSIILLIVCLLCVTHVLAVDIIVNGGAGTAGPTTGDCSYTNGFCQYNSKNGSKGIRVSMAYCDANGCTKVTQINGKSIPVHDYFNDNTGEIIYPVPYYYFGKTKIDSDISNISMNTAIEVKRFPNINASIDKGTISLFPSKNTTTYFNDLMELSKDKVTREKLVNDLLSHSEVSIKDIQIATDEKGIVCNSSTGQQCPGYRILIEPIYWYATNKGTKNWLLTPTELFYLDDTIESGKLYRAAHGLYLKVDDVFFKKAPDKSSTIKQDMISKNNGYALNIINPIPDYTPFSCDLVQKGSKINLNTIIADMYNKGTLSKDAIKNRFPNGIDYGNSQTADAWWYVNECTCYGMYQYYQENHQGWNLATDHMFELTIKNIQNTVFPHFEYYNNAFTKYTENLNLTSSMTYSWTEKDYNKYNELKCGFGLGTSIPDPNPKPDPEPPSNPYNCTSSSHLGSCTVGDTIHYDDTNGRKDDTTYWNQCVFNDKGTYDDNVIHKTSQNSELTYYDTQLSNTYCPVYCVEELEAIFDTGNFTVKAGSNFVWGNSTVSGSRTCKTKSVDWNKFQKDLSSYNTQIEKAYNEYLVTKYQQDTLVRTKINNCPRQVKYSCTKYREEKNEKGEIIQVPYTDTCEKTVNDAEGYKYTWKGISYGSGATYASSSKGSTSCTTEPVFDVSTKLKAYNDIKNNANAAYNNMVSCYNWDEDSIYHVNPSLTLNYSDGFYKYSDAMQSNTNYVITQDTTNNCKDTTVSVLTNCVGTKCTVETKNIKKCDNVTKTREAITRLRISDNAYRFVLKWNHVSVHAKPNTNPLEPDFGQYRVPNPFTNNYMDVGYGNLPVSYSVKDGVYGRNNKGELTILYSNLGHKYKTTTDIDKLLQIDTNPGKWECEYRVESKLIPDKTTNLGIQVIYRPIDLNNPFPDMDASGRSTGSNWCYGIDCSNTNKTVHNVILNNRGVKGNEVYDKEPMYTFVLNAPAIRAIRSYNNYRKDSTVKNSYAQYIGYSDERTYDYTCQNGSKCVSEYLTKLIQDYGKGGTCAIVNEHERQTNFDKCHD